MNVNFLDNITKINQKFDEIKKDAKKRPRPLSSSPETTNESQASLKRPRKPNSKYTSISFENLGFLKLPKEDKVSKRVCSVFLKIINVFLLNKINKIKCLIYQITI